MSDLDLGFVVLGAAPLLLALVLVLWHRRTRGDEIWTGITPGEVPAPGRVVGTRRLAKGGEYAGTVAVRFTPPEAVTPGLAGVVIDGRADVVDISATMIDLAVRGFLRIEALPDPMPEVDLSDPSEPVRSVRPAADPQSKPTHDFRLVRTDASAGQLPPFEQNLLRAIFDGGSSRTLGELKRRFGMTLREAQIELYQECVDRGWYRRHPRSRSTWLFWTGVPIVLLGLVSGLLVLVNVIDHTWGPIEFALPVGLLASGALLLWRGRTRTPRTAAGTALRIQTLGFREYLTTAEADQIRFEEARDVFSRYLPYAIVFGVADRWARLFGEVVARAHAAGLGDAAFDLDWFGGLDALDLTGHALGTLLDVADVDLAGLTDILDGSSGLDGLAALVGDGGDLVSVTTEALSGIAEGVGEFASSAADVVDLGDGCSALDGCGCDF